MADFSDITTGIHSPEERYFPTALYIYGKRCNFFPCISSPPPNDHDRPANQLVHTYRTTPSTRKRGELELLLNTSEGDFVELHKLVVGAAVRLFYCCITNRSHPRGAREAQGRMMARCAAMLFRRPIEIRSFLTNEGSRAEEQQDTDALWKIKMENQQGKLMVFLLVRSGGIAF